MSKTVRLTDERIELDESRIAELDERLQLLENRLSDAPTVSVTYFQPDPRKSGGSYETLTGVVKKLDAVRRIMVLQDGREIPIDDICDIDSDWFDKWRE